MNIKEQIAAILKTIGDKQAEIAKTVGDAVTKGVTPDEDQEIAVSALEAEIVVLEKNLDRLRSIEKAQTIAVTKVEGQSVDQATKSADPATRIEIVSNLPKGIGFAQYARAKMVQGIEAKNGNYVSTLDIAKSMGFGQEVQDLVTKATLGTTTNAGFALPLVDTNRLVGEFVDLLRAATIVERLTGLRNVPFNSRIPSQLTGGITSWVGEGAAKPLTNPTYGEVTIAEHKLAAIVVYTQELMRRSSPSVDTLVRDDLIRASSTLIDATFIDAAAASATRPAGILNGVTVTPETGTTAAAYEADLMTLINTFLSNNLSLDGAYFIMSETRAAQLSILRDALGNTYFQGMSLTGNRTLMGIPVITSEAAGLKLILVKASEILIAQDGGVDVSFSDNATLVDGGTTHNLWQENKFAVRVEKFITWAKRRPVAAAYLDYAP